MGDGGPPGRRPSLEPVLGTLTASTLHEVQQLSLADVDDRGDEVGAVVGGETDEAGLIQPQGSDRAEAVRVLDERFTIRSHGVVDAAAGFTDRPGGGAPGSIGDAHPGSSNPAVLFSPGLLRTITVHAPPSALVPEERGGDPLDGKVAVLHDHPLVHLSTHAALWAPVEVADVSPWTWSSEPARSALSTKMSGRSTRTAQVRVGSHFTGVLQGLEVSDP